MFAQEAEDLKRQRESAKMRKPKNLFKHQTISMYEETQKNTLNNKVAVEIERIRELRARNYTKGDHFLFETKDFVWLLEKLTG